MPFTEDLGAFLDAGDFATAATYGAATVNGIFERQFADQMSVQTSAPTFLGKKSDFAAAAQGQPITIGSTAWTIAEFHHDPPGYPDMTLLVLQA